MELLKKEKINQIRKDFEDKKKVNDQEKDKRI